MGDYEVNNRRDNMAGVGLTCPSTVSLPKHNRYFGTVGCTLKRGHLHGNHYVMVLEERIQVTWDATDWVLYTDDGGLIDYGFID